MGESGVGKSTIVNMLYNDDHTSFSCLTPCKVGDGADSVTKGSSMHINFRSRMCIADTVGVGDPSMSTEQLLGAIRALITNTARGIHAIVLVMKLGRVPAAARANAFLLTELFHQSDLQSHGVLVLTHWDGEIGQETEDLERWIGDDVHMKLLTSMFPRVILTNNSIRGRSQYPECRQKCLLQLRDFIQSRADRIMTKPISLMDVVRRLVDRFVGTFFARVQTVGEWSKSLIASPSSLPTYCGECSVCLDVIEAKDVCALHCNHTFHVMCMPLGDASHCPLCRAPFRRGEWFDMSSY